MSVLKDKVGCVLCAALESGTTADGAALAVMVLWRAGFPFQEIVRALCFAHRRSYQNVIADQGVAGE